MTLSLKKIEAQVARTAWNICRNKDLLNENEWFVKSPQIRIRCLEFFISLAKTEKDKDNRRIH